MRIIAITKFGSHLYGTNIEGSDMDYKVVWQKSLRDKVLGLNTEDPRELTDFSEDDDVEFIELSKLAKDIKGGQTYTFDMLFTPVGMIVQESEVWRVLRSNTKRLVSKNMKGFVGYCVSQTKLFTKKFERLQKFRQLLIELDKYDEKEFLSEHWEDLSELFGTETREHRTFTEEKVRHEEYLDVAGKLFQRNMTVKDVCKWLVKSINQYGKRARDAETRDGKDWKAIYHAHRLVYELRELVTTGVIKFPLKKADRLVTIRKGELTPYPNKLLEWELGSALADLNAYKVLRDKCDVEWLDDFVFNSYIERVEV